MWHLIRVCTALFIVSRWEWVNIFEVVLTIMSSNFFYFHRPGPSPTQTTQAPTTQTPTTQAPTTQTPTTPAPTTQTQKITTPSPAPTQKITTHAPPPTCKYISVLTLYLASYCCFCVPSLLATFPPPTPEPQRNVSITAVRSAVRPSKLSQLAVNSIYITYFDVTFEQA